MTTRIITLSTSALAAVVMLGACTSADAGTPSPTPPSSGAMWTATTTAVPTSTPSSSAASATTTQAPTDVPKAATQRTEAGAAAFVKHYLSTYNEVSVKPRPGVLGALGLPGCKACATYETEQAYLAKYHQRYSAAPLTYSGVKTGPGSSTSDPDFVVQSEVTQSGVPIVDAAGKTLRRDAKRSGTYAFHLKWSSNAWRVSEIKVVA